MKMAQLGHDILVVTVANLLGSPDFEGRNMYIQFLTKNHSLAHTGFVKPKHDTMLH